MTIEGELQAIGAVARQMRARVPDARSASAWASALETSIRALRRSAGFLRSEAEGQLPEAGGGEDGYEGLSLEDAASRYASRASSLALQGAQAAALLAEKQAFVAACASLAPSRAQRRPLPAPDAPGQNSERPRRVELVRGGWLEDSGQTRSHGGSEHIVWVLTSKAQDSAELWGGRASA